MSRLSPLRAAVTAAAFALTATVLGAQAAPPAPPTPAAPAAELVSREEALRLGRITFERAMAANVEALLASADPALGASEGLRTRLETGLKQLGDQLGQEVNMTEERVMLVNGAVEYWRTAEFAQVPVPIIFRVVMGTAGKWRGFTANTEEQTPAGKAIDP